MAARWPEAEPVDYTLLKESEYLTHVSHEFRVRIKKMVDMRGKASAKDDMSASPLCLMCIFGHCFHFRSRLLPKGS